MGCTSFWPWTHCQIVWCDESLKANDGHRVLIMIDKWNNGNQAGTQWGISWHLCPKPARQNLDCSYCSLTQVKQKSTWYFYFERDAFILFAHIRRMPNLTTFFSTMIDFSNPSSNYFPQKRKMTTVVRMLSSFLIRARWRKEGQDLAWKYSICKFTVSYTVSIGCIISHQSIITHHWQWHYTLCLSKYLELLTGKRLIWVGSLCTKLI